MVENASIALFVLTINNCKQTLDEVLELDNVIFLKLAISIFICLRKIITKLIYRMGFE
jgi:hypothetical protein